eukprot:CAMPEP_0113967030 /NCGR_PEP_ID=MMETSP0011_2-20120614/8667_1 /TAXON_ID=101924 /ORGANISM="Rhodosorus marinus" /LENGTH=30 /DNA_ID=CAMNT_0000979795 /DNA_START=90 /DNA_END=179 /DNA_ORIENTATION=- /assembly_acc=CAM_ASM_000156
MTEQGILSAVTNSSPSHIFPYLPLVLGAIS